MDIVTAEADTVEVDTVEVDTAGEGIAEGSEMADIAGHIVVGTAVSWSGPSGGAGSARGKSAIRRRRA